VSADANSTLRRRLYRKGVRTSDGCLEFTGYICPKTGYGKISNNPSNPIGAHRAAWILENGPIGEDIVVRHKCDNRKCFEIRHLEIGTYADNNRDMLVRGRFDNYKSRIRFCPQGHEYDCKDSEGYRSCRTCSRLRSRRAGALRRVKGGVAELSNYCSECWFVAINCHCEQMAHMVNDEVRYEYKGTKVFS
jgi:hypothetical protein